MSHYRKLNDDGTYVSFNGKWIKTDTSLIINPSAETLAANGWEEYTPEVVAPVVVAATEPDLYEVVAALKSMQSDTVLALSDADAAGVAALFPTWESKIGQSVAVGERLWYDNSLYKVQTAHTVQADWTPKAAPALFVTVTNEATGDSGAIGNPISWQSGMVSVNGLYYTENGTLYKCIRDSGGVALYYTIEQLIPAAYFQAV